MTPRRPSAASRFAIRFIATYRAEVAGRVPHACGSTPTCSEYGAAAYREHGFFRATAMTVRRVARCRPPAGRGVAAG